MRRSGRILCAAGAAIASNKAAVTLAKGADSNAAAKDTSSGEVASRTVHIVSAPLSSFIPQASEAPELLQSYVEPKPFISARRLQLFSVSMAAGAAAVGLVYFLLSKSISNRVEEEQALVDRIVERNRLALQSRHSVLPAFVAPSSFDELYTKMVDREKEVEQQLTQTNSTLNTETMFHLKMWWNRCLKNIQVATDSFFSAQQRRSEAQARKNIEAAIKYSGYEVVELREIHS